METEHSLEHNNTTIKIKIKKWKKRRKEIKK